MGAMISSAILSAISIIVIPTLALKRALQGGEPYPAIWLSNLLYFLFL